MNPSERYYVSLHLAVWRQLFFIRPIACAGASARQHQPSIADLYSRLLQGQWSIKGWNKKEQCVLRIR